jgi:hypothetical protein
MAAGTLRAAPATGQTDPAAPPLPSLCLALFYTPWKLLTNSNPPTTAGGSSPPGVQLPQRGPPTPSKFEADSVAMDVHTCPSHTHTHTHAHIKSHITGTGSGIRLVSASRHSQACIVDSRDTMLNIFRFLWTRCCNLTCSSESYEPLTT